MVSYVDAINDGDSFPYSEDAAGGLYRFKVVGIPQTLGYVLPSVADKLSSSILGLEVDDSQHALTLMGGRDVDERSTLVKEGLLLMRAKNDVSILKSWRNETFPIFGPNREVLLHIERCACPLFGVVTYGAHAIAYVPPLLPDGEMKIWISRRARSKQTFGGMLDSSAAGGIASGDTPLETILRECEEEASLPPDVISQRLRASGIITNFYVRDHRSGGEVGLFQPEGNFVFDLPLPPDVVCTTNDGEAEEFRLYTVEEVKEALKRREFKPNSALVMLDFFVRHGILTSENEKDYVEIVSRLHRRLEFPLR
ncbi:thiamine pyrophosphokinase-related protein-like protein [Thelonectria olida]|uniref:Thiamine pyrophosphokinase-related protein-like protein n=1 Tax=Thelonectria olida TaxID=1576542 RepID=A0A9P9ATD8_9HYPO|nr:thiamine pyrophosphokinase-related protein-like protein [Thelonectria olida]